MILPNQLTVARIILTPIFVFFFLVEGSYFKEISLLIFFIAAITDWYDGWLARKFNYITEWGKFWDPLADKILTFGAFISFVYLGVLSWWMVLLIFIRDFVITALRSYADMKKVSFHTSRYAKVKTFVQMAFLYYLLIFYVLAQNEYMMQHIGDILNSLMDPNLIYFSFLIVTIITLHTGYVYIMKNLKIIKRLFRNEVK